jgi:hypothetical protein
MAGHADGAHQGRADQEAPGQQIGEEEPADGMPQVMYRPFQQRVAGGELPARQSLVEHKLEKRSQPHRPQHGQPQFGAGEGAG